MEFAQGLLLHSTVSSHCDLQQTFLQRELNLSEISNANEISLWAVWVLFSFSGEAGV